MNNHWSFQVNPWVAAAALLLLVLMAVLSVRLWRRNPQRRRAVAALESLRLAVGALIALTLCQPERVSTLPTTLQPEVAILCDESGSMATRDIVDKSQSVRSRADWLAAARQSKSFDPLKSAYKTVFVPFSSKGEAGRLAKNGTDLSMALGERLADFHNLRAVMLLSDGDWNAGDPPIGQAGELRARNVPVYTVLTGSSKHLPDVELSDIKFPAFCLAREKVAIPFQLTNHLARPLHTRIRITCDGVVQSEKEVRVLPGASLADAVVWIPTGTGPHALKISVPVENEELDAGNNARSFGMDVREEQLKVLVVESLPRWEYRYLRNALERDPGVSVDTLLLAPGMAPGAGKGYLEKFPATLKALGQYDVVFIGDIGLGAGELTKEQAQLIRGLVGTLGSGVVFLPGARGRQTTWAGSPLDDMLPVDLDPAHPKGVVASAETRFHLTELGSKHLLTMLADSPGGNFLVWKSLPGFTWNAAVRKLRPGADLLAVNPVVSCESGRMPILATRPFGNGQALFMGIDSAWRWRKGVEDLYHYRFWGQVIRWMAHKRHLSHDQGVRLFYSPETPVAGQSVYLSATLSDHAGTPITKELVKATLLDADGKTADSFLLTEAPGDWGVYQGKCLPANHAHYTLKIEGQNSGLHYEARLEVAERTLERLDQPAQADTLAEIARVTRGRAGGTADLDALVAQIKALPKAADTEIRLAVWSQWWWGLTLLTLLGIYWALRKKMGLI